MLFKRGPERMDKETRERIDREWRERTDKLKQAFIQRMREELLQRGMPGREETQDIFDEVVERSGVQLGRQEKMRVFESVVADWGPLSNPSWIVGFLLDEQISEVIFAGPNKVLIRNADGLVLTDKKFDDETDLLILLQQILRPVGLRVSEDNPAIYAQLPDRSEVLLLMPSVTGGEIVASIRIHRPQ